MALGGVLVAGGVVAGLGVVGYVWGGGVSRGVVVVEGVGVGGNSEEVIRIGKAVELQAGYEFMPTVAVFIFSILSLLGFFLLALCTSLGLSTLPLSILPPRQPPTVPL